MVFQVSFGENPYITIIYDELSFKKNNIKADEIDYEEYPEYLSPIEKSYVAGNVGISVDISLANKYINLIVKTSIGELSVSLDLNDPLVKDFLTNIKDMIKRADVPIPGRDNIIKQLEELISR